MTSVLAHYNNKNDRVGVSFWASEDCRTTLSSTAWLTVGEAKNLLGELSEVLASIPPEPRVVSAEDLGL